MIMDPNKRGNPPFEPSSYAAGLERRVKRMERWIDKATKASRRMLDGTPHEKEFGARWWREYFDQPEIVLSDPLPSPAFAGGE